MRRLLVVLCLLALTPGSLLGDVLCRPRIFLRNYRGVDKRVCRQSDAGSAHVAVLSVAPWEEYAASMQPQFAIDIERAMKESLAQTGTIEETINRLFAATLKIGAPTTSTVAEERMAVDAAGQSTTTSSSTTKTEAADASKAPTAPNGIQNLPTAAAAAIAGELDRDPFMHRWAALALYQEAQILSRFIADVAVPSDYRPYVVRLQVALMPNARREPYDTYATVTFLTSQPPDLSYASDDWQKRSARTSPVRVIPLLVTDNIEATRRADSSQQMRDIAASLLAMAGTLNMSAGVRSQLNRIVKSQSNDFNSLLTVARMSENSVRIRLGAVHGNGHYAMIPRTHNITVLVLAPPEANGIDYISKTSMNDAVHGDVLSPGSTGVFGWRFEDVVEPWIRAYELPDDVGYFTDLISYANAADYDSFREHVQNTVFPDAKCDSRCKLMPKRDHDYWWHRELAAAMKASPDKTEKQLTEELNKKESTRLCVCEKSGISYSREFRDNAIDRMWADVTNYNGTQQYSEGSFSLPPPRDPERRFFPVVDLTVVDDTQGAAVVHVRGGRYVDPTRVRARLRVESNGSNFHVEARSIAGNGGEVMITFPSVAKLLDGQSKTAGKAVLLLSYAASNFGWMSGPAFTNAGMAAEERDVLNNGRELQYRANVLFDPPPPKKEATPATPAVADAAKDKAGS